MNTKILDWHELVLFFFLDLGNPILLESPYVDDFILVPSLCSHLGSPISVGLFFFFFFCEFEGSKVNATINATLYILKPPCYWDLI